MSKKDYIDSINGKRLFAERAEYTKGGVNVDDTLNELNNNVTPLIPGSNANITVNGNSIVIASTINEGPSGPCGPRGNTGVTGARGPCGPSGNQGVTGAQGNTGVTGAQGPCGPSGAKGPCGPSGNQGTNNLGNPGLTGAKGPCGPSGNKGPCGPSGYQGTNNKGNQGVTGARLGPCGPSGAKGPCGPSGNPNPTTGPKGPCGPSGNKGPCGPRGNTGVKGATGNNSKLSQYNISGGFNNCDVSSYTPTTSWTTVDTTTTDSTHAVYVLYWFYCDASSTTNTFQIDVDVVCTSGTGSEFTNRYSFRYGRSEATFLLFCPPNTTHRVDVKLFSGTARSCKFKYEVVNFTYR